MNAIDDMDEPETGGSIPDPIIFDPILSKELNAFRIYWQGFETSKVFQNADSGLIERAEKLINKPMPDSKKDYIKFVNWCAELDIIFSKRIAPTP